MVDESRTDLIINGRRHVRFLNGWFNARFIKPKKYEYVLASKRGETPEVRHMTDCSHWDGRSAPLRWFGDNGATWADTDAEIFWQPLPSIPEYDELFPPTPKDLVDRQVFHEKQAKIRKEMAESLEPYFSEIFKNIEKE